MQRISQFRPLLLSMACNNNMSRRDMLSDAKCIHSCTSATRSYQETIVALNGLQSNSQTVEKSRNDPNAAARHIPQMHDFLSKLGITPEDLSRLNAIHVAGTKGKGSTCAFTDSILHCHGLRTGFYSSPHLVEVRERIRICGQPLSKKLFSIYFWEVYGQLHDRCSNSMPPYFMFLTLMAFYTFLQEKVDVAVIEVGLGGEYDCTNVLTKPIVVGLTPIGLDHTSILGDTLAKIAWQKSGILKKSVPAFTVSQPDGVLPVFKERAQQIGCTLQLVPPIEMYQGKTLVLGIPGPIQSINASLAIQLANTWIDAGSSMKRTSPLVRECMTIANQFFLPPPMAEPFSLGAQFVKGLRKCSWPGRFQTFRKDNITYFLDGAHTEESIIYCSKWFLESSHKQANGKEPPLRVLLFNCTGNRSVEMLLSPLAEIPFQLVVFTPNHVFQSTDSASDQSNLMVDRIKEEERCHTNARIWSYLQSIVAEEGSRLQTDCHVFPCLSSSLRSLVELSADHHLHVLVTGSLHLVGGVLGIVHPMLVDDSRPFKESAFK